ncbi:MAG: 2,3-bisphosphoglycerate-independent phosphoglycerate mutase [Patescibacteria group bacterium]
MKQVILLILDGWGWSKEKTGNAILTAKTPALDYIKKNYPFFLIQASGRSVGLPPLKEGDSEVGHLTIGAGRIIIQYLTIIDQSLKNGSFFENETFIKLLNHVKNNNGDPAPQRRPGFARVPLQAGSLSKTKLHLMGLLTSGTVHASLEHLISIIKYLKLKTDINEVFLHLFTDGKDSGKKESLKLIEKVEKEIIGSRIKIASLIGRDFAMDRDNNWKLTKMAYDLLVYGTGERTTNPMETIVNYHNRGITDELIPPTIVGQIDSVIGDNDGILFFNFREDSAKQLTKALANTEFNDFETKKFRNLFFATMTNYGADLKIKPIFKREKIKNTLGEILQNNNKKQLHIAETIKYAHVTYFLNGLREEKFEGETDVLIPSSSDYLDKPEMRVKEITQKILEELDSVSHEFVVANFANPDILSHSGNLGITTKGIEVVDEMISRIYETAKAKEVTILITSDHGNAENMTYIQSGEKETRHNSNPVPLFLVSDNFKKEKIEKEQILEEKEARGMLQDIAPTILNLMEIEKPPEMTGVSLIQLI